MWAESSVSGLAIKTPRVESVSRAPLGLFRPGSLRDVRRHRPPRPSVGEAASAPQAAALASPSRSASGPLRHQGQRRRAGICTVREQSSESVQRVLGSGNLPALRRASPEERRRPQHQRLRHLRPAPSSALRRPPAAAPRGPDGVPALPRPVHRRDRCSPYGSSVPITLAFGFQTRPRQQISDCSSCHTHKMKGPENIDKTVQNQLKRINKHKSRNWLNKISFKHNK